MISSPRKVHTCKFIRKARCSIVGENTCDLTQFLKMEKQHCINNSVDHGSFMWKYGQVHKANMLNFHFMRI
jgi:hypothetical protein